MERYALFQLAVISTGPLSSYRSICKNHYIIINEISVIIKELGDLTAVESCGMLLLDSVSRELGKNPSAPKWDSSLRSSDY